jgi:hypothetical protein
MARLYPASMPHTGTNIGMAISGTLLDLAAPRPKDIYISDIIFQMTRIGRYNCATLTRNLWTVGDHLRVSDAVYLWLCKTGYFTYDPEIRVAILLHDAEEIYTGDLVSPVKRLLRKLGNMLGFSDMTERLARAIALRFGLRTDLTDAEHDMIKDVDQFAYEVEKVMHRPVFADNIPIHCLTARMLPTMQAFRHVPDLESGWKALHALFSEVARELPSEALERALRECVNPYAPGVMEQLMQAHAAASQAQSDVRALLAPGVE